MQIGYKDIKLFALFLTSYYVFSPYFSIPFLFFFFWRLVAKDITEP